MSNSTIAQQVSRRWRRILDLDDSATDGDFFELGGTSLMALQLLAGIEEDLGLTAPLMSFAVDASLAGLINALEYSRQQAHPQLVPMQALGEQTPLFFIHAEFGHVLFAQSLADALAPDQPMFGIQSRGLDGREEPITSAREMAAHYISLIKLVQPWGPYRIGGFCLGALLALEITNQLEEVGEEVAVLAVFSTDASWMNTSSPSDQVSYHLREMGAMSFSGKWRYLWFRAKFRLTRYRSAAIYHLRGLYARLGQPFPARLRCDG